MNGLTGSLTSNHLDVVCPSFRTFRVIIGIFRSIGSKTAGGFSMPGHVPRSVPKSLAGEHFDSCINQSGFNGIIDHQLNNLCFLC